MSEIVLINSWRASSWTLRDLAIWPSSSSDCTSARGRRSPFADRSKTRFASTSGRLIERTIHTARSPATINVSALFSLNNAASTNAAAIWKAPEWNDAHEYTKTDRC